MHLHLAARGNQFVAALADEVWFAHVAEGGQTEQLQHWVRALGQGGLSPVTGFQSR